MTTNATLIFPSSVPAARDYAKDALRRGETVVAASSLQTDEIAAEVSWERLPNIRSPEFEAAFAALVERHGVVRVFCPVTVVHAHLAEMIEAGRTGVSLVNSSQFAQAIDDHVSLAAQTSDLMPFISSLSGTHSLDRLQVAAVLRHAMRIFGETYPDKIAAMIGVLSDAPPGDVIEIGALFGRSAAVLAIATNLMGRSDPILVVDPWTPAEATQEALAPFVRDLIMKTDWAAICQAFKVNLLPYVGSDRFNYLQRTSLKAYDEYSSSLRVASAEFGETFFSGRIAVLHVDGNHDLKKVEDDINAWGSRVVGSGWLIIDDYRWSHGDGPATAADRFLETHSRSIKTAFAAGGALFIKLAPVS